MANSDRPKKPTKKPAAPAAEPPPGGAEWDIDVDADAEHTPPIEMIDGNDAFPELDNIFADDPHPATEPALSEESTGLHDMPPGIEEISGQAAEEVDEAALPEAYVGELDRSEPTDISMGDDDPRAPSVTPHAVAAVSAREVAPPPAPAIAPRRPADTDRDRLPTAAPPAPPPRQVPPEALATAPGSIRARAKPARPHEETEPVDVEDNTPAPEADEPTILNDHDFFRKEGQRLARARDWVQLAGITSAAVDDATWAHLPESKAALLVDLAGIYRDRLKDLGSAEDTFRKLTTVDPSHGGAIDYLSRVYRERGDWRALYDLYAAAIEPTWDPNQRLEWTRETVAIATEKLASPDLAIESWERLWRLGDAVEETSRALSEVYRRAGRWDRLAEFLAKRAAQVTGAERVVALREIAEAYLSGLRDQDRAAEVLEQILAERGDDPIALLALARVLARRKDWEALVELGARPLDGLPPSAILDFRRLVADALWSAGDLDRAVAAHERVLELDPEDAEALKAKEEYLTRTGKSDALVQLLADRAEHAKGPKADEERGRLYSRAAEIAERDLDDPKLAIALWEKRASIESGRLEAYQALAALYDNLGDPAGVARALEGQLSLTRHPGSRIELLRRLGDHAAHRLGDDARAESCWREIVAIIPDDKTTRDELIALHRRRGDFEALDRTLSGQAWRAVNDAEIVELWRAAARNIEENIADPRRTIRAWQRVIDLAPADEHALHALVGHHRALAQSGGRALELIAALEAELLVTADRDTRVALALEIGRLWEAEGDAGSQRAAALSAYLRVLRWNPTDGAGLAGLARLRGEAEAGAAIGALDVATTHSEASAAERIELVRQGIALLDPADRLGRFYALRRVLWLSGRDPAILEEVARAAADAGAWTELAAVFADVASESSADARAQHHRELATIYERHLGNKVRAFLTLQAIGQQSIEGGEAFEALARLAEATKRHEDLLALLDVTARAGAPLDARRVALRRRAAICEKELEDAERAFHECVRLLALDPHDAEALADARRLAKAKKLWRPLDALYAELWDRAASSAERIELSRARHQVHAEHLSDPVGALDQLLVIYRIDPEQPGITDQLFAAADALKAWDRVLPVVEARTRALGEAASPEELARLAQLHEDKRSDPARAFELYAEAYVLKPSWSDLREKLERLADSTGRYELLAGCYRLAAARSGGDALIMLDLYNRITALHTEKLKRNDDALDVHRRILQLQPSALPSLEAVIEHHRAAGKFRDLRDRLQQWIERASEASPPERVGRWLEIARISREQLSDPETALATYALILEIEPGNEEALQGVRSLTEGQIDPTLELRRLRIELSRANAERRVEIQLACAQLQEEQLDDLDGAVATLRALILDSGAAGPGFEPLSRVFRARGAWSDLVDLIESRAAVLSDRVERIAALEQAFAVCDEHPDAAPLERKERLYRRLLEERPGDAETRRRLLSLYRDGARYQELAELLQASIAALPASADAQDDRALYENELGRVLDRGLGRLEEAEALLAARAKRDPEDAEVLLGMASLELRRNNFTGWLALREQHAKRLSPTLGALTLCHLAEACDENTAHQAKVANYYREARAIDPTNPPAMEALKAIGRRAKSWRAAAAILPDRDEATLSWAERASRLRARGDQAATSDRAAALSWYLRAVAVDPDHYQAWEALALVHRADGDHAAALEAQRSSLAAFERSTGPEPAKLREHAQRIQQLGTAVAAVGDAHAAARLSLRAYHLMPSFAAAALAVADQRLSEGEGAAAYAIYDRVLREQSAASPLADADRLHATFRRGELAAQLGRVDQAILDLREGLRIEPLHSGVLNALADALAAKGRVAAAIQHYTQALLVVYDQRHRGELYARLGRLWEDRLNRADEAGVCYDLAIAAGVDEHEVMVRALRHYRRSGRPERALAVIERLLPTTSEAAQLAALWTERGGILATDEEERAIEAFDMALSYDPGSQAAIAGLSEVLERRGDWEQLLQIHEARTESGGAEERAEALRALARIASSHLHDPARTEQYLRAAVELAPKKEDFEQLLEVYGSDPARAGDRRSAIAGLLTVSGPYMPRVIELGKMLVSDGQRRWAWCLLSPLMNSTMPDPLLKSMVLELRKEFEKSDNTGVLSSATRDEVRHHELPADLLDVLAALDQMVTLGRTTPEQCGASGVSKLDERTAVGKSFAAIAARLGLENAVLSRAQELPEPYLVLDTDTPQVLIRAELLQLLSVAETGFLFASMLEQARSGARVIGSLAPEERPQLLGALLQAVGLAEGSSPLADGIRAGVDEERRAGWAERLRPLDLTPGHGAMVAAAVVETTRRVGLVAAGDLRFVARLLTRLDDTLPKMQTVGKLDDLDEFIGGAPPVRSLLGFAATDPFGRALAG